MVHDPDSMKNGNRTRSFMYRHVLPVKEIHCSV